jgi:two-component SAPR family response regulator
MQIFLVGREKIFNDDISYFKQSIINSETYFFVSVGDAFWEIEKNKFCPDAFFLDLIYFENEIKEITLKLLQINSDMSIIYIGETSNDALRKFCLEHGALMPLPICEQNLTEIIESAKSISNHHELRKKVSVTTFGNFDVFVDSKPVHFKRNKSKEVLAYLVNKNGTSATHAEISAALWEEGDYNRSRQKQLQVIICDLQKSLDEAGIGNILIKKRTGLMVDKTLFDCDFYRFLKGDEDAVKSFVGEYMGAYSWAETTAGFLFTRANDFLGKK